MLLEPGTFNISWKANRGVRSPWKRPLDLDEANEDSLLLDALCLIYTLYNRVIIQEINEPNKR